MKEIDTIVSKVTEPKSGMYKSRMSSITNIIIPPDLQNSDKHIVRPSTLVRQNSVASKVSKMVDSIKGKTDEALEVIKDAAHIGPKATSKDLRLNGETLVIPVLEQKFSIDKETVLENVVIEKRWIEEKKLVEVPVRYERVFVNNEEIRKSGLGEAFTQIKDAILKIIPIENDKKEDEGSNWIPLLGPDTNVEMTVPLYAEQLVVSKKIVKVGDMVIRKREVTEQENIDVGPVREEVTIENPGDRISQDLELKKRMD